MVSIPRWARSEAVRQTYLGSSAQITLTIHDRDKVPRREAYISRLPDELLVRILELATLESGPGGVCDCEKQRSYAAIRTLLGICHRLHRIVLPFLYHTIRFNYPQGTVPPTRAVRSLHRRLQKNPSLRQHCLVLWVNIDDIGSKAEVEEFFIANDLVTWLTKVRCLKIHGGFEGKRNAHTWALIRNVTQHMRELEHLSISRQGWGLYLSPIIEHLEIPSLRKLNVHGVSETKGGAVVLERKVLPSLYESSVHFLEKEKEKQAFNPVLSSERLRRLTHTPRNIEPPHFPHSLCLTTKNHLKPQPNSSSGRNSFAISTSKASTTINSTLICPCFALCS